MEPSTMASTSSWRAISGSGRREPLSGHDGGTGDDAKIGDTGELSDELVGHAVGEVLLAWVAGEVLKRKHGNRADGGATVAMEEAGSQRMGAQGEYEDGNENGCAQRGDQPKSAPGFDRRRDGGRRRDLRRSRRRWASELEYREIGVGSVTSGSTAVTVAMNR